MISRKLMTNKFMIGSVAGVILGAGILTGYTLDNRIEAGRDHNPATVSQSIGGESGGEHGFGTGGGESGRESGIERAEGGGGSEEGSGAGMLAPNETFDTTRGGARLIMNYDAATNAFTGTVENTTNNTLTNVRIEVHLSNGAELGPTTPVDMAPGEVINFNLPSTPESFTGWTPHAEVGSGEGGESGGEQAGSESGPDGPEGPEFGSEASRGSGHVQPDHTSGPDLERNAGWTGSIGSLRGGNPVCPHDGAEHFQ